MIDLLPSGADAGYRTYTGQDGAEHRYMLTFPTHVHFGIGHDREVTIEVRPLGGEHDYNALVAEALEAAHQIARLHGDVVTTRQITITITETVSTIRP
jgi:hypothetical protein